MDVAGPSALLLEEPPAPAPALEKCPVQGRARCAHLQPPELTGQVQGGFLCLVDEAGVGLVLEQHL